MRASLALDDSGLRPYLHSMFTARVGFRIRLDAFWLRSRRERVNSLFQVIAFYYDLCLTLTCNLFQSDSELELTDKAQKNIGASIKINLNLDDDFMGSVDEHIRHLDKTNVLTSGSGRIDDAAAGSQAGSLALAAVGTCTKPLGEALHAFVKLMDGVADVRHSIAKAFFP